MDTGIDLPGFADPVGGAQRSFRALLAAMSRPGSLHWLGMELTPPACLNPAAAAVLLTLADVETTLWMDQALAPARGWITFHCGAAFTDAGRAGLVLGAALPALETLNGGSDDAPEDAATVIVQVAALGEGTPYRLSGPGLAAPGTLLARGLPDDFATRWQRNHALYPRGVDLLLCAGTMVAALPRSVRIEEG